MRAARRGASKPPTMALGRRVVTTKSCREPSVQVTGPSAVRLPAEGLRPSRDQREVALVADSPKPRPVGILVGCDLQPTVSSCGCFSLRPYGRSAQRRST
jgi:hypothetical protein